MSTQTPNIGLTKVVSSETIGDLQNSMNASGGNMDIIDTKMGPVGNTSLQAQINTLNSQMANINFFSRGTLIPNNSDMDNYKTPGKYYSPATANTSTMSNTPVTGGFSLMVIINGQDWINQYAVPVNGSTIKHRYFTGSTQTWSPWATLTFTS